MRKRISHPLHSEPGVVNQPSVESLLARLERETSARRQAEALLEEKSLEVFQSNEALRHELDERLRSEARFRDLTELSSDWYWEQDENCRFTILSGGVLQTARFNPADSIGKTRREQPGIIMSEEEWATHEATLAARQPFQDFTYKRNNPEEQMRYVSISGRPIFDAQGNFKGYRGIGKDITDRIVAEERIQYLAYHDGLTTLPNRASFSQILNHGINHAHRYNKGMAVLFIDLDRFKNINDTLGHEAGDALLQEVGKRLKHSVRQSDTVARLGGDEFVILLEELSEPGRVATVAGKILSAIIKPFQMLGQEFRVTASIGISIYPEDGQDEQTLMKKADIAMYHAKEEGKNNFQFHSERMDTHSFERLALESSLRRALERNEFQVHYQAKMDFATGQMTGMEALIRWQHPDLGMVSPVQFIPIAEETGLIVPIGKWVLRTACLQNKAWQKEGLPPLSVAVNLSARQFADENLLADVTSILNETGMNAAFLELEITESMIMHNVDKAVQTLTKLKTLGIRLSIDDFGTGYSSLSNLKRFPIDTLKIDRSFIRDLPGDSEDKAITRAIIAMGKSLNMTLVAEGVETQEQAEFLRAHACDQFQGYYFSRPVDKDKFAELLRSRVPETSV
jgi:diguanylate cyclase (GGDEF)-like protein/PAS domain S-box-containing protein